jgi:hypothetical protein
MPVDLSRMSAAKLAAHRAACDAAEDAACKALIDAGRGHETGGQTRAKAEAGDALAMQWAMARDAAMDAWSELQDRRRWHGSDKPIRRRADHGTL